MVAQQQQQPPNPTSSTTTTAATTATAPAPKMRSSIACARCRKSKVKCVNNGVHTTCKACESSNRECVYPVPGGAGGGSAGGASSSSNVSGGVISGSGHPTGESTSGQQVMGAGSGVGSSTGGSGGGSGSGTGQSRQRPKKPSASAAGSAIAGHGGHGGAVGSGLGYGVSGGAKGEGAGKMKSGSAGAGTGAGLSSGGIGGSSGGGLGGAGERPANIYGALVEGCGIPSAEDVLGGGEGNIGWQFWHAMHEHFQHHYSTELPFVHAPTFLARRLDLPSQHIISRSRMPSASSTPSIPTTAGTTAVDKTSYPLCLGILTLTGRFYPPLIKLHQAHASASSGSTIPSTASGTQSSSSKLGKPSVSSANTLPAAEGRKIGEFYARVLRRYLFTPHPVTGHIEISVPTVEKVQGLLMLAVHEWIGEGRSDRAQVWVGFAGRLAAQMGLGRTQIYPSVPSSIEEAGETAAVFAEEEGDLVSTMEIDAPEGGSLARKRRKLSVASGGSGGSLSGSAPAFAQTSVEKEKERKELIIRDEIARRTFWSLFMLDRQLCSGGKRDLVVRVEDINGSWANRAFVDEYEIPDDEEGPGKTVIRLPCSDKSFTFGDAVITDVLRIGSSGIGGEGGSGGGHDEGSGENETELCRIIRGMEIWGRIRRWRGPSSRESNLSRGGSPAPLPEQVTVAYPAQPPNSFMTLNMMINSYSSPLPNSLHFSPDNLNAHIHSKTSTSYAIIHVINFLSRMILHKTNLPFIPPNQQPASQIPTHVADSAKEVFRSARGLLDLMKGLTDWNVGIETPLVAYAVYIAGVWSVYACSFPYLDEENQLAYPGAIGEVEENANVQTAIDQLKRFHSRWNLGGGDGRRWVEGVTRLAHFYRKVKAAATAAAASSSPKPGRINGMNATATIVPSAVLHGDEGSRFERMWRELGRDELAGWVSPPVPATQVSTAGGLAPPQPQGQQVSGKKGSTGGERKRVSPQPPQAKPSDRWQAINKSPINPSSPPSTSSAIPPAGTSQAFPQTSSSHPQQQQQQPQQQPTGSTSPTLIDQFLAEHRPTVTSPKKRPASEMDSTDYPFPNMGKDIESSDQTIHHQTWTGAQQQQQAPTTSGQGSISGNAGGGGGGLGVEVKMEWEDEKRG